MIRLRIGATQRAALASGDLAAWLDGHVLQLPAEPGALYAAWDELTVAANAAGGDLRVTLRALAARVARRMPPAWP